MADQVRVTIAPGHHMTMKHPSGLPGMPAITLAGGDTLLVSLTRAEELYQAGRVLHPVTGQERPPLPPSPPDRPRPIVSQSPMSFAHAAARHEEEKAAEAAAEDAARGRHRHH